MLLVLVLAGAAAAGPTPDDVAKAYGIESFDQITRLSFTFNVERNGKQVVSRSWIWETKTGQVTYSGPNESGAPVSLSYNRRTEAKVHERIERGFINDSYWLLFPFHMVWDFGATVTLDGTQPLPIPPGEAQRLTVRYAAHVGFTPGDVYELYVGPDQRILQWVFRAGGKGEPRPATWADHRRLGPIVVSLDHRGPAGQFRLWFSDVSAEVDGKQVLPTPLP